MERRLSPITQKWMGVAANVIQFVCIVGIVVPFGYWFFSAALALYQLRRASDEIVLDAPWNRELWARDSSTVSMPFPRYSMASSVVDFLRPGMSRKQVEKFLGPINKDFLPNAATLDDDMRGEPAMKRYLPHSMAARSDLYYLDSIPDHFGEKWDEYLVLLFDKKQQLLDAYVGIY